MAIPASREQLKDWCLRQLGFPVIEINVDDDQVEDRIDELMRWLGVMRDGLDMRDLE